MIAGLKRARRGSRNINQSPDYLRAYKAWNNMLHRTLDPQCKAYPNWGGRGITVDPSWLDWDTYFSDMGPMPKGMSLERKDVNGPYAKWNCTYVPLGEQSKNTRRTISLTHDGRTMCLAEWAREIDMWPGTLYQYIVKHGLTLEQVINGERPSPRCGAIRRRLHESGVSTDNERLAVQRLAKGWSPEEAASVGKFVVRKTAIEIDGEQASVSEWCRRMNVARHAYERAVRKGERPIDALKRLSDLS